MTLRYKNDVSSQQPENHIYKKKRKKRNENKKVYY